MHGGRVRQSKLSQPLGVVRPAPPSRGPRTQTGLRTMVVPDIASSARSSPSSAMCVYINLCQVHLRAVERRCTIRTSAPARRAGCRTSVAAAAGPRGPPSRPAAPTPRSTIDRRVMVEARARGWLAWTIDRRAIYAPSGEAAAQYALAGWPLGAALGRPSGSARVHPHGIPPRRPKRPAPGQVIGSGSVNPNGSARPPADAAGRARPSRSTTARCAWSRKACSLHGRTRRTEVLRAER